MKKNLEITRNETENSKVIRVCENYELDRYTPSVRCSQWECESVVEDILYNCKIWTPCRDYKSLHNFDLDEEELTGNLQEDLKIFESKVGDEYECYVLGAYVHSGTSFSISKEGDHRCRFDSGQLGFIAIPKAYSTPDIVAHNLTSAWNGEFMEFSVYDELKEDVADSVVTDNYNDSAIKDLEEMYGVDFSECEVKW
jgi:hypothetical protein